MKKILDFAQICQATTRCGLFCNLARRGKKSSSKPTISGWFQTRPALFLFLVPFCYHFCLSMTFLAHFFALSFHACYWLHLFLVFIWLLTVVCCNLFHFGICCVFIFLLFVYVVPVDSMWLFLIPCCCYCFHFVVFDSMILLLFPSCCYWLGQRRAFIWKGRVSPASVSGFICAFSFVCFYFMLIIIDYDGRVAFTWMGRVSPASVLCVFVLLLFISLCCCYCFY